MLHEREMREAASRKQPDCRATWAEEKIQQSSQLKGGDAKERACCPHAVFLSVIALTIEPAGSGVMDAGRR
jgi:hypothetical protein